MLSLNSLSRNEDLVPVTIIDITKASGLHEVLDGTLQPRAQTIKEVLGLLGLTDIDARLTPECKQGHGEVLDTFATLLSSAKVVTSKLIGHVLARKVITQPLDSKLQGRKGHRRVVRTVFTYSGSTSEGLQLSFDFAQCLRLHTIGMQCIVMQALGLS